MKFWWRATRIDGTKSPGSIAHHYITKFWTFGPKWKMHAMTALHDSMHYITIQHMTSTWRSDSALQPCIISLFWPYRQFPSMMHWALRQLPGLEDISPQLLVPYLSKFPSKHGPTRKQGTYRHYIPLFGLFVWQACDPLEVTWLDVSAIQVTTRLETIP